MKMEPVFPKAELALFLTVRTVAGSSARSLQTAHAKVDEGTSCRVQSGGGESSRTHSSPKSKTRGPRDLSCLLESWGWQKPGALL